MEIVGMHARIKQERENERVIQLRKLE